VDEFTPLNRGIVLTSAVISIVFTTLCTVVATAAAAGAGRD
jgi:multisubunit Na+/H+ antiporter MnhC subunit